MPHSLCLVPASGGHAWLLTGDGGREAAEHRLQGRPSPTQPAKPASFLQGPGEKLPSPLEPSGEPRCFPHRKAQP